MRLYALEYPVLDSVSCARDIVCVLALVSLVVGPVSLRASDVTWNNMTGNFLWNTSDNNWSTGAWNNANGDGAIFGPTGAGTISLATPINVNSLNFTANGYTLGGAGSLNFVSGTSTLGFGFINVEPSVTATINAAISSLLHHQTWRRGARARRAHELQRHRPWHRCSRRPPRRPHRGRRKRP